MVIVMCDSKAWESWAPRVNVSGPVYPKVEDTGKTFPKVDPENVRKAIGAEALSQKTCKFNSDKAKAFLLRLAADFTEDNVFREEALELVAAAMTSAPMDSDHFYWILDSLLEWDMSSITEAVNKIYNP